MTDQAVELSAAAQIAGVCKAYGITVESVFVPWSQSRNKGEKQPSLNWRVTVKRDGREIVTTDYGAGSAHCPAYQLKDRFLKAEAIRWECEHGNRAHVMASLSSVGRADNKPLWPKSEDVLASLAMDSDVIDAGGFEEWASSFGYDVDSRKAEAIYRACLDIALKLRSGLGENGLAALRAACQDY